MKSATALVNIKRDESQRVCVRTVSRAVQAACGRGKKLSWGAVKHDQVSKKNEKLRKAAVAPSATRR